MTVSNYRDSYVNYASIILGRSIMPEQYVVPSFFSKCLIPIL